MDFLKDLLKLHHEVILKDISGKLFTDDDVFEQNTFIQKYHKQNYCLYKVCNCSIREPRVKIKDLISTLECDHNPSLCR